MSFCRIRGLPFLLLSLLVNSHLAVAQVSPDEHAKHHPAAGGAAAPASQSGGSPGTTQAGPMQGGMMQGMGEMMKTMLAPKKEFYPALVDIPNLTEEQWRDIQQQAHARMQTGLGQLSQGLGSFSAAVDADNFSLMQQALSEMHEGLRTIDSGLSAHRLLAEGESPHNIALNWFKTEMNLRSEPALPHNTLGFSPLHLAVMSLLVLFSVTMILMYFFKMRRASALLERLTAEGLGPIPPKGGGTSGGGTPSGGAPPSSGPSSGSTPSSSSPQAAAATRGTVQAAGVWAGKLRIESIRTETPNVKTFRLVSQSGQEMPFTFLPGQFLTLSAVIDGRNVMRSYTIASSPLERTFCELTIKREDQGLFSRYLHDQLRTGDWIQAKGPSGTFVFTGTEAGSIVLIAGGVGITPMMSIIRYLTAKKWDGNITLLFSCRTMDDFIFREEITALQSASPRLNIVVTMTRADSSWTGKRGRFTKESVAAAAADIATSRIHLCGPNPFMDEMKQILGTLSVPKENIKLENFGPQRKDEPPAQSPLGRAGNKSIVSTATTVSFSLSEKQAALPPDMSVLEAAESVGVSIDNSCRAGTCGICKIPLLSGTVTMEIQDGITPEEKASGLILACQAKATDSIVVGA